MAVARSSTMPTAVQSEPLHSSITRGVVGSTCVPRCGPEVSGTALSFPLDAAWRCSRRRIQSFNDSSSIAPSCRSHVPERHRGPRLAGCLRTCRVAPKAEQSHLGLVVERDPTLSALCRRPREPVVAGAVTAALSQPAPPRARRTTHGTRMALLAHPADVGAVFLSFGVGSSVLVRYDPEDPRRFAIQGWDVATVDKLFTVLGSVFTAGTSVVCSSGYSVSDCSRPSSPAAAGPRRVAPTPSPCRAAVVGKPASMGRSPPSAFGVPAPLPPSRAWFRR